MKFWGSTKLVHQFNKRQNKVMGNMRKFKRGLQSDKVYVAEKTQQEKMKLVKKMVSDRIQKDANFAKELIDTIGEVLPPEMKKEAEEKIAKTKADIDAVAAEKLEKLEPTIEKAGKDCLTPNPLNDNYENNK
jgi:hypothetical protein